MTPRALLPRGVRRLPSGQLRVQVSVMVGGERRYASRVVPGDTPNRELDRVKAELWQHLGRAAQLGTGTTLAELVEVWLVVHASDVGASTTADYRGALRVHVLPWLGDRRPEDIDAAMLSQHWAWRVSQGASRARIKRANVALSGMWRWAISQGIATSNPAQACTVPKVPRSRRPAPPAAGSVTASIADARGVLRLAVRLAVATGRRRGELCALTWGDVDLDAGRLTVHRAAVDLKGGGVGLKQTKTGSRTVMTLDPDTVAELRAARKRHLEDLMVSRELRVFEPRWKDSDRFILTGKPWPAAPGWITHQWMAHVAAHPALAGVRFHDLRHLHASVLLAAGLPMTAVAERLGHASPAVTMAIYGHAVDGHDAAAAEAVRRALGGGT